MISVTRLDGSVFVINADLIETIEATPDTVITFAHDKKVVVQEGPDEIIDSIVRFRRRLYADPSALVSSPDLRPTRESMSHTHKGTGAATKRIHLVQPGDQNES